MLKDQVKNAQKPGIIHHWKCPAHNCTAEYIGETNRSLKERVSADRNQTSNAIRNHHISTKHQKAELKDFTIIERDSNTLHSQAKGALHIHIKAHHSTETLSKSEYLQYSKNFWILTQLEHSHSLSSHPRGHLPHLVFQHKIQLTLHTFLISIYNRSVIPMFTPFKPQDNWIFRSPSSKKYTGNSFNTSQSVIFSKKYLSFKFSGLVISSSTKAEEGTS